MVFSTLPKFSFALHRCAMVVFTCFKNGAKGQKLFFEQCAKESVINTAACTGVASKDIVLEN